MRPFSAPRVRSGVALIFYTAAAVGGGWYWGKSSPDNAGVLTGPATAIALSGIPAAGSTVPAAVKAPGSGAVVPELIVNKSLPVPAQALLKSLDPAGGLKNQAAILQYVSSLDAAEAKALALSFEGKGYPPDKKTLQLFSAVHERWAELDPEGLIQKARKTGDYNFRWAALSAGFEVLASRDPDAAWKLASELGPLKGEAQRSLIESLSSKDPAAAFALASKLNSMEGRWTMSSVMGGWATRDPAAAAAAAQQLPRGQMRSSAVGELMARWAVLDFDTASAWANTLTSPQEKVAALSSALGAIATLDPEKSLSLLDGANLGYGRLNVINTAISSLAMKDFDAATSRALALGNFADKTSALRALGNAASDQDREKLLALAGTLPPNLARSIYQGNMWGQVWSNPDGLAESIAKIPIASVREEAMTQVVRGSLSYYQPEAAASLFEQMQASSQKPETAGEIARRMAANTPEEALAWAQGLGTEALKKAAVSSAIQAWAEADPAKAGQEIAKIPSAETRAEISRSVARSIAGRSIAEAETWVATLSGDDRTAALGSVVEHAATQSPEKVEALYTRFASSLTGEMASRSEYQAVAKSVASNLAQTDATRAAAWTLALPAGGARDEAISGVVSTWASYDATAASEWLHEVPAGKGRDLAAGNLVTAIAQDDPESAWAWANSIQDDARRREAAAAALTGWKANGGRDAAMAALSAAGFSESDYKELARKLN